MTADPTPSDLLARALDHLAALVGFDTTNPPRRFDGGGVFDYLRRALGSSFACQTVDLGQGYVYLLATRGAPRRLFNFHLDTVPADLGWGRDPFALAVEDGRAIGLGAADIKGASAAMLAALEGCDAPAALLFSSDEEGGGGRCVAHYLARGERWEEVLVAEPTLGRALIEHRGYVTATGVFSGRSGHGSAARALADSAIHAAVRWAGRALDHAAAEESARYGPLTGIRFHIGTIAGGTKPNMIASRAELKWSARPRPDQDADQVVATVCGLAPEPARVDWRRGFTGTPLPVTGAAGAEVARRRAAALGLELAPAADFWSEAALFSAAGHVALVLGPGDIAQAHAADEWLALDQLAAAAITYRRLLGA
jgi:acetylornithine deacetylase